MFGMSVEIICTLTVFMLCCCMTTTVQATECPSAPGQNVTQNTGSCEFRSTTCGYTLSGHWIHINGGYNPVHAIASGHDTSNTYLVIHWTKWPSKGEDTFKSPQLGPGTYCLSFWYFMAGSAISMHVSTSTGQVLVSNLTDPESHHIWKQHVLTITETANLQIVFKTIRPIVFSDSNQIVGIDDIVIAKAMPPITTPSSDTLTTRTTTQVKATPSHTTPSSTILTTRTTTKGTMSTYLSGNCSFNSSDNSCGYALSPRWMIHHGQITLLGTIHLIPGGHDDDYFAVFDQSITYTELNQTGIEPLNKTYAMTSPSLPPGNYCLSFWYSMPAGNSAVGVITKSSVSDIVIWSAYGKQLNWTEQTVDIFMNSYFQIAFQSYKGDAHRARYAYVGIDDISLLSTDCSKIKSTTTQTTSVSNNTHSTTTMTNTASTTTSTPPSTTTTSTNTPSTTSPTTPSTATTTTSPSTTTSTTTPSTTTSTTTPSTTTSTTTPSTTTATTTPSTTTSTTTPSTTTSKWSTSLSTTPSTTKSSTTPLITTLRKYYTTATTHAMTGLRLEDAIHPGCSSVGWNITVDMDLLNQLYPGVSSANIYFGDNTCHGMEKESVLIFQHGLRECLTSERIAGDNLMYENSIIYAIFDPITPFIIRQHKWTYTVECDVSRNEATSSHVHHDVESHHSSVASHYSVNMTFYRDPNFNQEITENPLHANIGDDVYVKVFTTVADWTVKMRVHTCYTKPTDDAPDHMKYFIIKDGCETDANTHIISQSTHETRFVFQDFEYSTNHEGLNIYCNATFCETKDYSQPCLQTCNPNTAVLVG